MKKVVITILLLLLSIVNGIIVPPLLTLNSANSVTGVLGENYTFTCLLDPAADYSTLKWKLGDGGAIQESMQGDLTNRVYYYFAYIGVDSVTLVIKNTVSTDFANYICEVNATNNQITTIQLSLFGKL